MKARTASIPGACNGLDLRAAPLERRRRRQSLRRALDPESHLVHGTPRGDRVDETVEEIPWTAERLRTTAVIQSNLYDALDAAIPDSFLPIRQRVALAWAIA